MTDETETYTKEKVDAMIAEAVAGLKGNQSELLKEKKSLAERLKAYEGIDPEKARQLEQAAAEAERKKAAAEGDWKSLEAQLLKKIKDQEDVFGRERGDYTSTIEELLIDRDALAELAKVSDSPELLLPHVKRHVKVEKTDDGKYAARVIGPDGVKRISAKKEGNTPMSIGELLDEMKQDKTYALAFRGTGSSGGGAAKSRAGGDGPVTKIAAPDGGMFGPDFLTHVKNISEGKTVVE